MPEIRSALTAMRAALLRRRPLPETVERDLARRVRNGDEAARRTLIEACLPFVFSIAWEYRRWGIPLEDIVQEGSVGLIRATHRFDPERNCRLVSYAAYWIRAQIREYLVRSYRMVRIGGSKKERKALQVYRRTGEDDPMKLSALSGLSPAKAEEILPVLAHPDVALDRAPQAGPSLAERLASNSEGPEDLLVNAEDRVRVRRALWNAMRDLSPRERRIVRKRWLADKGETLEQIGKSFGVGKERARQIEERTRQHLRERLLEVIADMVESVA